MALSSKNERPNIPVLAEIIDTQSSVILAAALLTSVLTWLFSGNIRKTDADRLWDESKAMLEEATLERKEAVKDRKEIERQLSAFKRINRMRWRLAIPVLEECAEAIPEKKADIIKLIGMVEQEEWDDMSQIH